MAGMSQSQLLQNAHSTKFLNYGHLGTITYDEEHKTWETLRIVRPHIASTRDAEAGERSRSAFPIRHLSSKVVYYGLAGLPTETDSELNDSNLNDSDEPSAGPITRASNINAKIEDNSGSQIEWSHSDAIALDIKQSPNRSALLAIGSAVSTLARRGCSELVCVPVAASVSDCNAQSVRLVCIGQEAFESLNLNGNGVGLKIPSISNEHQAHWTGSGGPVQQICFAAESGYSSTWMATRLQTSTTIFHPLVRQKPVPSKGDTLPLLFQALPSSLLDANPVVSIPISRTGGHPHAHVSFHPKDHAKLALIDEHGNWSVWLVDGERQESPHSRFWVTLMSFGKIWTWDYEKRLRESAPYHDGWHRISWCIRSQTLSDELFICNRRTAAVYKTSGDLLGLQDLHLGHARENQMILDVQWSRTISGHCFVLTSTRLFWLYFKDAAFGRSGMNQDIPHILLAWQHFRDRGDTTLELVLLETGLTTIVLMVSRFVSLVLVFRIGLVNGDRGLPVSVADPLPIFLPEHPYPLVHRRRISSLLFRAIESRQEDDVTDGTESRVLFKLFSLYEDLTIVEHLYSSTESDFGPITGAALSSILHLPDHSSLRFPRVKSTNQRGLANFVVPDDWAEEDGNAAATERCPEWRMPSPRRLPNLGWQDVYAYLADEGNNPALNTRIEMAALLEQFPDSLDQFKRPGIPLLSDILPQKLYIADVDYDSEHFDSSVFAFNSQQIREKRLGRLPMFLSVDRTSDGVVSLYDVIVATHLTPLSPQVTDRIRVNKERLARKVTADLLLATTAIFPGSVTSTDDVNWETVSEWATSQHIIYSSSAVSTTSRPAPSASTVTASAAPEEDPILTRLQKYTTISLASPISSPISTNPILSSILRHLPTSPTINPATYNWHLAERTLAAEQEEELTIAAGKADPRARKQAEKARLSRVKREEVRKRAADEIASSQRAPPRVLSSHSGAGYGMGFGDAGREVQSSQVRGPAWDVSAGFSQGQAQAQARRQEVLMTLPERGVFGSRPGVAGVGFEKQKDKGKKRAAGF